MYKCAKKTKKVKKVLTIILMFDILMSLSEKGSIYQLKKSTKNKKKY